MWQNTSEKNPTNETNHKEEDKVSQNKNQQLNVDSKSKENFNSNSTASQQHVEPPKTDNSDRSPASRTPPSEDGHQKDGNPVSNLLSF